MSKKEKGAHEATPLTNNKDKTKIMKVSEVKLITSDWKIPTFIRNIFHEAISNLESAEVSADPVIVSDKEFDLICKHSGIKPIDGRVYRFIRLYDELENGVDIQTERSFIHMIASPMLETFRNEASKR